MTPCNKRLLPLISYNLTLYASPSTLSHTTHPNTLHTLTEVYQLTDEVLGRGAHSCVTTCTHRVSGKKFAVKIVPKGEPGAREKVLREIEILYHCRNNKWVSQLLIN